MKSNFVYSPTSSPSRSHRRVNVDVSAANWTATTIDFDGQVLARHVFSRSLGGATILPFRSRVSPADNRVPVPCYCGPRHRCRIWFRANKIKTQANANTHYSATRPEKSGGESSGPRYCPITHTRTKYRRPRLPDRNGNQISTSSPQSTPVCATRPRGLCQLVLDEPAPRRACGSGAMRWPLVWRTPSAPPWVRSVDVRLINISTHTED